MAVILKPDILPTKDRSGGSRFCLGRLPRPYQPQTPQYYAALCMLDWLQSVDPEQVPGWASQITNARRSLESAWSEESGTRPATNGYLRAEMGRVEYLAGNFEEAERLFNLARDNFRSAGLDKEAAQIDDMLVSLAPLQY